MRSLFCEISTHHIFYGLDRPLNYIRFCIGILSGEIVNTFIFQKPFHNITIEFFSIVRTNFITYSAFV